MYVLNKIDAITIEELDLLDRVPHYVPISGKDEWNFDELLEKIWEYAKMFRMYVHCHVIRVIRASCIHFSGFFTHGRNVSRWAPVLRGWASRIPLM